MKSANPENEYIPLDLRISVRRDTLRLISEMAEAYGVKQKIASKILFTTTLISIITIPLLKLFMDLFIQTT